MTDDPAEGIESATEEPADDAESEDGELESVGALADRVTEYDEDLGAEVDELEHHVSELEADLDAAETEIEDLQTRLKRTQADFQNYKKRAKKRQNQLEERATEDLVERLLPVRDNLVRALDQDEDVDIRDGVESTLTEFDHVLDAENVATIDPEPGEEVDPTRHEVMMRVDSDQPEGTVADVFQPGYEMADKVIREAQVTVSKGDGE